MSSQFAISSLPYAAQDLRPRKSPDKQVEGSKLTALAVDVIHSHSFSSSSDGVLRSSSSSASAMRVEAIGSRSSSPGMSTPRSSMSEDGPEALVTDDITQERYVEPMVDKCGHTYNRATWMMLPRAQDARGEIDDNLVICPISREIVRLNKLRPNIQVKKMADYVEKNRGRIIPSPAPSERSDRDDRILQAIQEVRQSNANELAALKKSMDKISEENAGLHKDITNLGRRLDEAEEREKVAKKRADESEKRAKKSEERLEAQLNHVRSLGLFQKINSICYPGALIKK